MLKSYGGIIRLYPKIPISEERRLISEAQKGLKKSKDEIVLWHIGFLVFRIHKIAFPAIVHRFGEDLLEETILIVYRKIESYDLNYCDKKGNPKPVKFISYIWKRIDGFILDFLKKELCESNFYNRYDENRIENSDLSIMSASGEADITISQFFKELRKFELKKAGQIWRGITSLNLRIGTRGVFLIDR